MTNLSDVCVSTGVLTTQALPLALHLGPSPRGTQAAPLYITSGDDAQSPLEIPSMDPLVHR